jgi:hypothetical protein
MKYGVVLNMCAKPLADACETQAESLPQSFALPQPPCRWCRTNFDAANEEGLAEEDGVEPPEVAADLDVVIPSSV